MVCAVLGTFLIWSSSPPIAVFEEEEEECQDFGHAPEQSRGHPKPNAESIWVVVKIMVPFWIPVIIRHLIFRVPNKGP